MDDLLSAALSEAGLSEFLTTLEDSSSPSTSLSAEASTSEQHVPSTSVELKHETTSEESIEETTKSLSSDDAKTEIDLSADDINGSSTEFTPNLSKTTSEQYGESILPDKSSERGLPSVSRVESSPKIHVSASQPSLRSLQQPRTNNAQANRSTLMPVRSMNGTVPAGPGPGRIIRRVIQTANGPQTQLLQPYRGKDGHTIYRQMPMNTVVRSSAGGSSSSTTSRPLNGSTSSSVANDTSNKRLIVVRQNTPNGAVFLRRTSSSVAALNAGSSSINPISRGGFVKRMITRRGVGGQVMTNPQLSSNYSTSGGARIMSPVQRVVTGHSRIHSETGHEYVTMSPPLSQNGNAYRPANQRIIRGSMNNRGIPIRGSSTQYTTLPVSTLPRSGFVTVPRTNPISQHYPSRGIISYNNRRPQHVNTSAQPQYSNANSRDYLSIDIDDETATEGETNGHSPRVNGMNAHPGLVRPYSMIRGRKIDNRIPRSPLPRSITGVNLDISTAGSSNNGSGTSLPHPASMPQLNQSTASSVKKSPLPPPPSRSQKAKEEMKSAMLAAVEKRTELDEDEENLGYAETYSDYRPAKLRSGLAHPDSVVETASLSSVQPPDVRYQISIPEHLIDTGAISALQLEAVIYACQMHEQRLPSGERTGYLIGDGAGVGKGRTVACIIFENYIMGRKRAIWLSVSSDLKFDSERDLRDIGAGHIEVYALNKLKYAKISGKENGYIKKGVVFATYSSLIGEQRTTKNKFRSRLKQLIQWFGVEYDGVIILDECHRAKNLVPTTGAKPTKTGRMVLELQKALPNARVVYASATGATEPRNMAYMTRIGLWGPGQAFPDFSDFINAVERRGVGAMEIVAMDMKQRGLYLARQLSFRGVSFRVEEVPLSEEFVKMYDDSVKIWMECRRQFQVVLNAMSDEERSGCKQVWGQFWACHQRFFKYLCIGAKVEACVKLTRDSIKANKCVVIGLQSTGEARTLEALEEMGGEITEFVSTSKAVLQGLIEKHFPVDRGSTDIFRDFDKMFDDFDRPKRRKIPRNGMGYDILEELGLSGPSSGYDSLESQAKRARKEASDGHNSSTSSSGDGSDEDDGRDEDSNIDDGDDADSDDDIKLGDNEEDWLKALLAEAASSSESEEDNGGGDDSDTREDPDCGKSDAGVRSAGEEDFNPFACDFSQNDPWAAKQQVVEDSPSRKCKDLSILEAEERRLRRKARIKRRRKRARKIAAKEREAEKTRQLESDAMKSTATDFISSSHIIEDVNCSVNPQMIKAELLAAIERLGPQLPPNTLDQLIDELGGPEFVAEMTGRKGRVVTKDTGDVGYEKRDVGSEVAEDMMNMEEKDKFMKGEKMIAIISEAASSGISLQSDRRAENKCRRVHITLELPWSADKAIQQFGRTHRSNQVSAPEYVFLISELAGEKRFASIVAKRLESLGALTHGDRRATESRDLSQFNLDTKYGRAALDVLLRSVIGSLSPPLINPPSDYRPGNFFQDMRQYLEGVGLMSCNKDIWTIEKDAATIAKFLNRILGLPVHAQNALFYYFTEICNELIAQAKHDGTYDMGIMDLGTGDDQVRRLETRVFLGRAEKGYFRVEMHKIGVERGVSWDDAMALYKEHNTNQDGFYVSIPSANARKVAALVYGIGKKRLETGARLYAVTRPSIGRSSKAETLAELTKRFVKVEPSEAEKVWTEQFQGSSHFCQHSYIYGKCKNEAAGTYCETGRRTRTYFVLSGSVLSVWPIVEAVLTSKDKKTSRMQIIRVRTEQDQKIVGLLVLPNYVRTLVTQLEEHCGRCYVEQKKTDNKSVDVPPSPAAPSPPK